MKKRFYSNGKLLISGEYLVLEGAKAFAIPTKFGQSLVVEENIKSGQINWFSYDSDNSIWFEDVIFFSEILKNKIPEEETIKNTLLKILSKALELNPFFMRENIGYTVYTTLTFSRKWGLGTSSTLINNIAQWAEVDAFELLEKSFGGSGYDIACAQSTSPILYALYEGKSMIEKISFSPKYIKNLYFVYLNKKQNSKNSIMAYRNIKNISLEKDIATIDQITEEIITAKTITDFGKAILCHEKNISEILKTKTVQDTYFSDFDGFIKSLGAWGGDFVLVASETDPQEYFISKGYDTIIEYEKMVL